MIADPAALAGEARPSVSVVLPYYNGERTVLRTLTSLAAQDYPEIEWVVVDDASTEPLPPQALELLRARGSRARVLRHDSNQGLSRTLNDGLLQTRGVFVLILHQDIEMIGTDWISRAVAELERDSAVAVVTGYYGIPAADDLDFVKRAFGFARRQFHRPGRDRSEQVTFTEFKCDLTRRSDLEGVGGFPTQYRICGEDIMVSYALRQRGRRILKVNTLQCVQRFTGQAETVGGNLDKEFRFGESMAGVLLTFRGYSFHGLSRSPYARSRSLHRAFQPVFALAVVVLFLAALIMWSMWVAIILGVVLMMRVGYYTIVLGPEFREVVHGPARAAAETIGAAILGLTSDFTYSLGVLAGTLRKAVGAPL